MCRRPLSIVAGGHAINGGTAMFLFDENTENPDDSSKFILKKLDPKELATYKRIGDVYKDDPVLGILPKFHGIIKAPDSTGETCEFLCLTNLLQNFTMPKVVDIKLGIRTFLESESSNPELRNDLYQRMCKLFPIEVTEQEHSAGGVTKLKWMSVRDRNSTTGSFGFRIDGVAGYQNKTKEEADKALQKIRTKDEASEAILAFVEEVVAGSQSVPGNGPVWRGPVDVADNLLERLRHTRELMQKSKFVSEQELIGTSLLIVADALGNSGIFWIDFAKTMPLPEGVAVTHSSSWTLGNHEDGVLRGIDNLIDVVERARKVSSVMAEQHSVEEVTLDIEPLSGRRQSRSRSRSPIGSQSWEVAASHSVACDPFTACSSCHF